MTQPDTQPIRKSLLPSTPPPEWEFSTALATGPADQPGLLLVPSDAGPVVVRRCVTYGEWEPVRPDRWADEPETDARAVSSAGPAPDTDRQAAYDAVFAYIRQQPRDFVPTTIVDRNAMIWRAVHAALDSVLPAPDQRAVMLTDREKAMLGFALEMAQEEIHARSLEVTDEDRAALEGLRRLAEAQQDAEPERGCAHCGGGHDWDDCEEYTALVAREARQEPTQDGEERETDEQRADREETERDHTTGDHTYCGITCETELPTEHLRNFVIAKGYPGTKGALDELLRRAAVARPGQTDTDEEARS